MVMSNIEIGRTLVHRKEGWNMTTTMSTTKRKRRGQGEGAIFQRKDGRWVASLDLGWSDGKRQRQHLQGRTRREV